jgi:hypothetical protein
MMGLLGVLDKSTVFWDEVCRRTRTTTTRMVHLMNEWDSREAL